MNIIFDGILSFFASLGILLLLWMVFGSFLLPIRLKSGSAYTVLRARGSCPDLNQAVDGALFLLSSGRNKVGLIIADDGMDEEAREVARLLAENDSRVTLCPIGELESYLRR